MPTNWLTKFVSATPSFIGCTRTGCGTCGAIPFKNALRDAAIAELRATRGSPPVGTQFTDEDVVRTVIDGLRHVPVELADREMVMDIVAHYRYPLLSHGVFVALTDAIAGSPVGHALRRREELAAKRAHERAERARVFAAAEAERLQLKREAFAAAAVERIRSKQARDVAHAVLVAELAALSPADRLRRVATDTAINLSHIPSDLIPIEEAVLETLGPVVEAALMERIGSRRGPWRRVAQLIRARQR